jgi:hypothetical protein
VSWRLPAVDDRHRHPGEPQQLLHHTSHHEIIESGAPVGPDDDERRAPALRLVLHDLRHPLAAGVQESRLGPDAGRPGLRCRLDQHGFAARLEFLLDLANVHHVLELVELEEERVHCVHDGQLRDHGLAEMDRLVQGPLRHRAAVDGNQDLFVPRVISSRNGMRACAVGRV